VRRLLSRLDLDGIGDGVAPLPPIGHGRIATSQNAALIAKLFQRALPDGSLKVVLVGEKEDVG
jgi:hypothetical protein